MSDKSRKAAKRNNKEKDDDDEEEKHCICDSRDYSTLMICCDYCSIWYHAKCMGLTSTEVERIDNYACKTCQKKDKRIVYVKVKKEVQVQRGSTGKRKQSISGGNNKGAAPEKKAKKDMVVDNENGNNNSGKEEPANKKRKKSTSIVANPAILLTTTTEIVVKKEVVAAEEKDGAIAMFSMEVKTEKVDSPMGGGAGPSTCSSSSSTSSSAANAANPVPPIPKQHQIQVDHPRLRCANCIGCFRDQDCGKCVTCVQASGKLCVNRICLQVEELLRQMQQAKVKTTELSEMDDRKGKKGRKPKYLTTTNGVVPGTAEDPRKRRSNGGGGMGGREDVSVAAQLNKVYLDWMRNRQWQRGTAVGTRGGRPQQCQQQMMPTKVPPELEEKQCMGPDCINSARMGSGYCSENCGLALAQLRLKAILPQHVNNYFDQIPANQTADRERLNRLETEMAGMRRQLKELEDWKDNIHQFLGALKGTAEPSGERERNEDEGLVIGCPVCAGEFPMREISKHAQSCYVRSERQTTYGTEYKMPNDTYGLYCDAFNKVNGTYCKRLRSACAEHYKDEYDLKICGCPLSWFKNGSSMTYRDLFFSSDAMMADAAYCQEKRKNCRAHLNWIQTAYSLIDNERMNLVNRIDELAEQHHSTLNRLLSRGDILTLFTSRTINNSNHSSQMQTTTLTLTATNIIPPTSEATN